MFRAYRKTDLLLSSRAPFVKPVPRSVRFVQGAGSDLRIYKGSERYLRPIAFFSHSCCDPKRTSGVERLDATMKMCYRAT
jgi:hypothetical protein